jgi:hypothetical protein
MEALLASPGVPGFDNADLAAPAAVLAALRAIAARRGPARALARCCASRVRGP